MPAGRTSTQVEPPPVRRLEALHASGTAGRNLRVNHGAVLQGEASSGELPPGSYARGPQRSDGASLAVAQQAQPASPMTPAAAAQQAPPDPLEPITARRLGLPTRCDSNRDRCSSSRRRL